MDSYRQSWERVPEGPKPERSRVDDYTPTTEEVRDRWGRDAVNDEWHPEWAEEFDRWLAARDAARDCVVAERAWDEGNAARTQYEQAIVAAYVDDTYEYIDAPENPYRESTPEASNSGEGE